MSEELELFEGIKKEVEKLTSGVKLVSTKNIFANLVNLIYQDIMGNSFEMGKTKEKLTDALTAKVGAILGTSKFSKDEKGKITLANGIESGEIKKAQWLSDWGTEFINDCVKAAGGIDVKNRSNESNEVATNIMKKIMEVYKKYTSRPWWGAISRYWGHFDEYFGKKSKSALNTMVDVIDEAKTKGRKMANNIKNG